MPVNVMVGLQRGDEGKGRFVDMAAAEHDIVARFNGGNNAGHTVVLPDGRDLSLHQVPSGVAYPHIINVIGNGTFVNPEKLIEEIDAITSNGIEISPANLRLSSAAHLILPHHIYEDQIRESGEQRQGSTKSGIAQVASSKAMREGLRVEEIKNRPDNLFRVAYEGLMAQQAQRDEAGIETIDAQDVARRYVNEALKLGRYVTDTVLYLNQQLRKDHPARILAEGAQAFLLDIDHGMYPYTTSSSTTTGGVAIGLGVPPCFIEKVTGVTKAVQSHVGEGPFVTEVKDEDLFSRLHGDKTSIDAETGKTTGRTRSLGYLDLPQIRRSIMVNGVDEIALSKLDWFPRFGDSAPICIAYERKGKQYDIAPDAAYKLSQCTPIYEDLPTWEEPIQDVRSFADLPLNAQRVVKFIESQVDVKVSMIGVGPKRDQVIVR